MSELFNLNWHSDHDTTAYYSVTGGCGIREAYRTETILSGSEHGGLYGDSTTYTNTITGISAPADPTKRFAFSVSNYGTDRESVSGAGTNAFGFVYDRTVSSQGTQTGLTVGSFPLNTYNVRYNQDYGGTLITNIPIFATLAEKEEYCTTQNDERALEILQGALNFVDDETIPDGQDFTIRNAWTTGEWTEYGSPAVNFVNWRCVRGRIISGRIALYRISGINNGALKWGIKSDAVFYGLETSTDGNTWTPVLDNVLPFSFFYRPHLNELGLMDYGLSMDNDYMLQFPDETDADRWVDDGDNATDAENWEDVAPNYPPQVTTGTPDTDPTEMGEVFTRAFFSQQYICSAGAMQEIAGALFDTDPNGIWEDIKKGLEMYGDSPVDDIQGCMFFPFPLSNVFTNTQSQNYIYFGGYKFDLQSHNVDKIIYPNGHIDFGSWACPYRFGGSFRDYAPYRRLYCYLPYIGWTELDLKRYIGKSVTTKYYIDTRTGGCMACLFADGILYDYFQGQMGINMPITATDFTAYANAQINTLLGGAGAMKNNAGSITQGASGMLAQGATMGATMAGLAPVAGLAVGAGVAKTMYGLTQNNINNFNVTKGGSSSMLNAYLPQNVMFLDEVQKGTPTPNEKSLMGYPSNASGAIQNFSGYLECDAVNLICDTATDNERAEIMAYLHAGVYI